MTRGVNYDNISVQDKGDWVSLVKSKKSDLVALCNRLGIVPTKSSSKRGTSYLVNDYVDALQNHFGKATHPLYFRLPQYQCPHLSYQLYNIPLEDQKRFLQDYDWEVKVPGVRAILVYSAGKFRIYSRYLSTTEFLPEELTDNLIFCQSSYSYDTEFILDVEIMSNQNTINTGMIQTQNRLETAQVTLNPSCSSSIHLQESGSLSFTIYPQDVLFYGVDICGQPLFERYVILQKIHNEFLKEVTDHRQSKVFDSIERCSNTSYEEKQEWFESVTGRGCEYVVIKNPNSKYEPNESRPKDGWLKKRPYLSDVKKRLTGNKDIYAFLISGSLGKTARTKDKIDSLYFGVYLLDINGNRMKDPMGNYVVHQLLCLDKLSSSVSEQVTDLSFETPRLKRECLGAIGKFDGPYISSKTRMLVHPVFLGFDRSLTLESCCLPHDLLHQASELTPESYG